VNFANPIGLLQNRNPNSIEPMANAATPSRSPSFKNSGTGTQNFQNSKINSDSCSCVRSIIGSQKVVYHGGGGQQIFQNSKINGVKVSSFSEASSSSGSETRSCEICCGTSGSFNNYGGGFQKFNGAEISSG